jgi:hypothetical protein
MSIYKQNVSDTEHTARGLSETHLVIIGVTFGNDVMRAWLPHRVHWLDESIKGNAST